MVLVVTFWEEAETCKFELISKAGRQMDLCFLLFS